MNTNQHLRQILKVSISIHKCQLVITYFCSFRREGMEIRRNSARREKRLVTLKADGFCFLLTPSSEGPQGLWTQMAEEYVQ